MPLRKRIAVAVLVMVAVAFVQRQGFTLPIKGFVNPLKPIDSPFPAEGYWLAAGSQKESQDAVDAAINAEVIRKEAGLDWRSYDYDRTNLASPWQEAIDRAEVKGGGKPYYFVRHGNKADEGPLEGDADAMLKTLQAALEGVR